jgi:hypothetical protein
VQSIANFIKRLTHMCFQSLHHRFVDWTKPSSTSLMLGTVTDLARSKSELVAENALLRQQLIILRGQVKRPTCTKTDRLILVLLARASRAWKHALFIVQPETDLAVASPGIALFLEIQVQSSIFQTKDTRRNRGVDQGNGGAESALGSGTEPWRITQAGHPRLRTHHSEVHEAGSHTPAKRPEVGNLCAQSRRTDLGV